MATNTPDMRDYFKARIDYHVNGMMARSIARLPQGVRNVKGDVDSREIIVVLTDGTEIKYEGGKYSSRKVNGCYAPLMPKKVK